MPRLSKKAEEAKKAAAAPVAVPQPIAAVQPIALAVQPHQPRQIDVEGFIRVRDSVHNRLLTILDLIKSFSVDYYRQTSLLLGEHSQDGVPGIDFPLPQLEHAVQSLAGIPGLLHPNQEYVAPAEEKKERKKRTHDPNAPKRPLTPYFLYMQTARPIIASDLGAEAPKGAVQEEGQRRWKAMGVPEKAGWNNAYQYNLRLYQARVHSYKQGGNPDAKLMSDEEAAAYADEHNIVAHGDVEAPADDQDAIAEQLQGGAPAEASDEEAPPAKTPKKPVSRKRKSEAAEVEPPKSAASAVATPDTTKKRRRTSKAADAETTEAASTKKGARGKKAKN